MFIFRFVFSCSNVKMKDVAEFIEPAAELCIYEGVKYCSRTLLFFFQWFCMCVLDVNHVCRDMALEVFLSSLHKKCLVEPVIPSPTFLVCLISTWVFGFVIHVF